MIDFNKETQYLISKWPSRDELKWGRLPNSVKVKKDANTITAEFSYYGKVSLDAVKATHYEQLWETKNKAQAINFIFQFLNGNSYSGIKAKCTYTIANDIGMNTFHEYLLKFIDDVNAPFKIEGNVYREAILYRFASESNDENFKVTFKIAKPEKYVGKYIDGAFLTLSQTNLDEVNWTVKIPIDTSATNITEVQKNIARALHYDLIDVYQPLYTWNDDDQDIGYKDKPTGVTFWNLPNNGEAEIIFEAKHVVLNASVEYGEDADVDSKLNLLQRICEPYTYDNVSTIDYAEPPSTPRPEGIVERPFKKLGQSQEQITESFGASKVGGKRKQRKVQATTTKLKCADGVVRTVYERDDGKQYVRCKIKGNNKYEYVSVSAVMKKQKRDKRESHSKKHESKSNKKKVAA